MSFIQVKEVAENFEVSLKTIYNYLHKYPKKIRREKRFWKTFVEIEDFQNIFEDSLQINSNYSIPSPPSKTFEPELKDSKQDSIVQTEFKEFISENTNLKKVNTNLQEQVSKYALLLSEEKSEKKDLMTKYDSLQDKYHEQSQQFSVERVKLSRNFYLVVGACIVLTLGLGGILFLFFSR